VEAPAAVPAEAGPAAVEAPAVPATPKPEEPKPQSAVILVSDRRGSAAASPQPEVEPATLAISSTGRRYSAPLEPTAQGSAVVFTAPRHAVAAASVSAPGLRPRHIPAPAFGLPEAESSAEKLALAGQ
jgi:hypothetical protein